MAHKLQMYENLRDMLETEIGGVERKHDINKESLDNLYKLLMSVKVVDRCIEREEMEKDGGMDGGVSMARHRGRDGRFVSYDGMSRDMASRAYPYYAMDGAGGWANDATNPMHSNARAGRDGDGDGKYHESRDNFRHNQSGDGGEPGTHANDGYSRDASRKKMVQKLETLMDDTMSENERKAIRECIDKIK